MALICNRNRKAVLASVLVAALCSSSTTAFAPVRNNGVTFCTVGQVSSGIVQHPQARPTLATTSAHSNGSNQRRPTTSLHMAAEDFNEAKYTEASWAAVAALTNVADFYEASSIEACLLLDVLLNPAKHKAGGSAEAATKVVEKVLGNAGVDVKTLRQDLEKYLGKQAKVSDNSNKVMGRSLVKVFENARDTQKILGVSSSAKSNGFDR